ncbi:MAG: hypothetical protein SV775_02745 [Thermodesulfobacteriota bacterium]|nr:hypothetical protein [Thermodesulfobacteriota bacterium]
MDSHRDIDRLISKSGIIGRQILHFYRFMRPEDHEYGGTDGSKTINSVWSKGNRLRRFLTRLGISWLADLLFTYYVGGSLTRQDQLTFAEIRGIGDRPYLLTLRNAVFCGIPMSLCYFLLGEGLDILADVHSYTEMSALIGQHIALVMGTISLIVDLFRALDAAWMKRCWAPFGIMPFVVNLPTYLNRVFNKIKEKT